MRRICLEIVTWVQLLNQHSPLQTAEKVAEIVRDIQKEFSNFDNSTAKTLKKLDLATKDVEALQTRINVLGRKLNKGVDDLEDSEETK